MARNLFCRHANCGHVESIQAGFMPAKCPHCLRLAKWSTTPDNVVAVHYKGPRGAYTLNENDRKMLRQLRIKS
jgi:phage FluMu protein Com